MVKWFRENWEASDNLPNFVQFIVAHEIQSGLFALKCLGYIVIFILLLPLWLPEALLRDGFED